AVATDPVPRPAAGDPPAAGPSFSFPPPHAASTSTAITPPANSFLTTHPPPVVAREYEGASSADVDARALDHPADDPRSVAALGQHPVLGVGRHHQNH